MRSVVAAVVAGAVALCAPTLVDARANWGVVGHSLTAAIAQGFLTTQAQNGVTNLLPDVQGDMSQVASWADSYARRAFPWSPNLHFINTPDWACNYDRNRDCNDDTYGAGFCVDGAIQNFTSQLAAGKAPLTLAVALKFSIHFIGDIHQPLHVSFTSDLGGNTIKGTFEGKSGRKLHAIWDEDILEKRMNDNYNGDQSTYLQYYMDQLQSGNWSKQVKSWESCPSSDNQSPLNACSLSWAQDTIKYACSTGYVDQDGNHIENGFDLEDDYYNFAYPVAEMQVAKGGIRLANVVNTLFAQSHMAEYTVSPAEFQRRKQAKERKEAKMMRQRVATE